MEEENPLFFLNEPIYLDLIPNGIFMLKKKQQIEEEEGRQEKKEEEEARQKRDTI